MTAVIYRRQSLDKQNNELGIERQLKVCKQVAKMRGFKVAEVLTDNNVSASKRGRPEYNRLVQMLARGEVTTVLILRIDRLLRLNDELEELIQLVEQHNCRVITAEGDIDLSTVQGRLMARILVSVARAEMEMKGARHKLANQQKAEQGLPHICRRPYGFEIDGITHVPEEVMVIRTFADMLMAGHGYKHIAWWANENGYRTTLGREWYPITIRNILTRKRYVGIREYNGVDYEAVWEPIFTREEWEPLQALIRLKKEAAKVQGPATKYMLTGLLTCGVCGHYLNGTLKRDNPKRPLRRIYTCRQQGYTKKAGGCGGVVRNADALEEWLRQCIIYRLDSPELMSLLQDSSESGNLSELVIRRDELRTKKNALVDDYADGTLDKAAYKRAVSRVEAALTDVDTKIESQATKNLGVSLKAGETVAEAWSKNDDEWKRNLVTTLIESVTVKPGWTKPYFPMPDGSMARFDRNLIDIKWRA